VPATAGPPQAQAAAPSVIAPGVPPSDSEMRQQVAAIFAALPQLLGNQQEMVRRLDHTDGRVSALADRICALEDGARMPPPRATLPATDDGSASAISVASTAATRGGGDPWSIYSRGARAAAPSSPLAAVAPTAPNSNGESMYIQDTIVVGGWERNTAAETIRAELDRFVQALPALHRVRVRYATVPGLSDTKGYIKVHADLGEDEMWKTIEALRNANAAAFVGTAKTRWAARAKTGATLARASRLRLHADVLKDVLGRQAEGLATDTRKQKVIKLPEGTVYAKVPYGEQEVVVNFAQLSTLGISKQAYETKLVQLREARQWL
jgi:hypothetical protein